MTIRDPLGTSELAPALDRVKRLRDGRVLLGGTVSVEGIQFSDDMKAWHPITDAPGGRLSDNSRSLWLDASATNAAARYYRAVAP